MLHNIFVRRKDEWVFEVSDSEGDSDSDSDGSDAENDAAWPDCTGLQFQDAVRDRYLRSQGWVDAN